LGIYAQRFDSTGNADGGEFLVNSTEIGIQKNSEIAALSDGGFVITWQSSDQDGNGDGVYAQRFDSSGQRNGTEFQVNATTNSHQKNVDITTLSNGSFVITWQSGILDGSMYGVIAQRFDSTGNKIGSEFVINTFTLESQENPAITALSDGGFIITWMSDGQDGGSFGIYAQRYGSDIVAVGSEFQVNTYTQGSQS